MENIILRLEEIDMNVVNRANKKLNYQEVDNQVSVEDLLNLIDELVDEVDRLEDKYKDLEHEIEEYYTPRRIDPYEEYGVNRNDFI